MTVPVLCAVQVPPRPEMPTEALPVDVTLDNFVAAAAAEIERREGYEVQLRAALQACATNTTTTVWARFTRPASISFSHFKE